MKTKRTRNYGMPKYKLIAYLYKVQGDICPLCLRSMFEEMRLWILWREQRGKQVSKSEKIRRKNINLNIDHIIPVSEGGSDAVDNLALTHRRCNDIKGSSNIYEKRPSRHS